MGPTANHFETPECLAQNEKNNNTDGCKIFGDVYTNGKEVSDIMWGGSFKYETDETKGYVMAGPASTLLPSHSAYTLCLHTLPLHSFPLTEN